MRVDLDWDNVAYLLALLKQNPGVRSRDRVIRRELVFRMTYYDGDVRDRMSPRIRRRVAYWLERRGGM